MSRMFRRSHSAARIGIGYWCGLGFIFAASVVNLLFDTYLSDTRSFPRFLAGALEVGGKLGLTLMLVAMGLAFIGMNWLLADATTQPGNRQTRPVWSSQLYFYAPPPLPDEPRSRGPMVLETQRYLPPPPRLSELAKRSQAKPTSTP
ncbi:MAG: hypothetical protein RMJ56_11970 [Gemmataceae bacterium]|nr:hypothetical protein [Gemmata sp.]MDW8198308.1 hypothetical protein [Gemmataceae bacterium]